MNITYRKLTRPEIKHFPQIDRSEIIRHIYVLEDGRPQRKPHHFDVPDWSPSEKKARTAELLTLFDNGATFFGAFDDPFLIALSALNHNFLPSGDRRLNLEGLWVSNGYRGQAIGRTLFQWSAQEAHKKGAHAMYVSSSPSENTVHFYQNLGCTLANPVDPGLLAKEPDDIHMELVLFNPIS